MEMIAFSGISVETDGAVTLTNIKANNNTDSY